jgi:hypothetical protein
MKHVSKSGAALAAAAFSLAVSGSVMVAPANAGTKAKVMCQGVNSCKGQAACKGGNHSCKAQNSCKGQGWIYSSADQCAKWGGKVL